MAQPEKHGELGDCEQLGGDGGVGGSSVSHLPAAVSNVRALPHNEAAAKNNQAVFGEALAQGFEEAPENIQEFLLAVLRQNKVLSEQNKELAAKLNWSDRLLARFRGFVRLEAGKALAWKVQAEANHAALAEEHAALLQAQAELEQQAHTDPLTGLSNRAQLSIEMKTTLDLLHRQDDKVAVLFLDLDNFKALNDRQGHDVGDVALQQVAQILKNTCRKSDITCRLGGDEFVVVLPSADDAGAVMAANKIIEFVQRIRVLDDSVSAGLGCSVGICTVDYADDGAAISMEELLIRADAAMYLAKDSGKNCAQFYDEAAVNARNARQAAAKEAKQQADFLQEIMTGRL